MWFWGGFWVASSMLCFSVVTMCWLGYIMSITFLSFGDKLWLVDLDFDLLTVLVLLMLLICFVYVYNYTEHYFGVGLESVSLNKIICLFVGVMASLVCTGDFLLTLIFWEYLGVVSFFLILFYDSYLSLRSSIITLVSSRFGDVCLFILICMSYYIANSPAWAILIFFFIIFTKSASFPFISWLLEAMRAPTPVSSLVHSSTLVAAGVWFSTRYDVLLWFHDLFIFSGLLLLTIFITGVCCFFFVDLKKIVALSTCNNISWCVLYLIFGDFVLSLFQLISHGVAKCMLFMLVGDVMSGSGGSQTSNCIYSPYLYGNWGVFSLFSVVLGLSGAPFIGVFFSKHFLLTNFMGVGSILLYLCVLSCVFISYFYSFRLCSVIINFKSGLSAGTLYFFNSGLMVYFWLFINYFVSGNLDEVASLSFITSLDLLFFQFISCITAYLLYNSIVFSSWSSSLFGCDNLVELFYYLFLWLWGSIAVFFYRWDSYLLFVFSGAGINSINIYIMNFLNIIVMTIFLFLMCFGIVYN
uniref:NADH:ubiquinone reductase (H(+)-translocating) n=1 Tax=Pseudanoplocephala crawfordi TaxID=1480107 RepID=A0A0U2J2K5_9CEST|nr:NADH dehydrogenase subunit 5 [Pseudanoplocephala crawfordi]ALJ78640.1 NADH dehydrogenase subunit 5 [Pseudanoplocephala crawfordi]